MENDPKTEWRRVSAAITSLQDLVKVLYFDRFRGKPDLVKQVLEELKAAHAAPRPRPQVAARGGDEAAFVQEVITFLEGFQVSLLTQIRQDMRRSSPGPAGGGSTAT